MGYICASKRTRNRQSIAECVQPHTCKRDRANYLERSVYIRTNRGLYTTSATWFSDHFIEVFLISPLFYTFHSDPFRTATLCYNLFSIYLLFPMDLCVIQCLCGFKSGVCSVIEVYAHDDVTLMVLIRILI